MNDVLCEAATAPLAINGVAFDAAAIAAEAEHHGDARDPLDAARHALAVRELLRQRAVALALIDASAPLDDAAVDALLERELTHVPQPDRADCERYYSRHAARFRRGDIVYASHVLFAVTERVPLAPLRERAQAALADVLAAPDTFEAVARASSNCPSAQVGGNLGNCCAATPCRSSRPRCSTATHSACCRSSSTRASAFTSCASSGACRAPRCRSTKPPARSPSTSRNACVSARCGSTWPYSRAPRASKASPSTARAVRSFNETEVGIWPFTS
jgi:hypothetical protein